MSFFFNLKRFWCFVSICVFYIGKPTSQTNSGELSGAGNENYRQGSSYFLYQAPRYPRDCREIIDQCSSSISGGVYLIKPDGYPEPFEVYCNNDIDSGGWTVIQRRFDGSVNFQRNWEDYKRGFGFLSSEFWVGNERLSFLTNQNVNELRIDIFLSNGTSFNITYNKFRISDERGKFALTVTGDYTGDAGSVITKCPQNMVYGNCACVNTCEDPRGSSGCHTSCEEAEGCVCRDGFLMNGEQCVSPKECSCYVSEQNKVLQDGETIFNTACTEKCTCNGRQLNCDSNFECNQHATCKVQDGVRQCYCNEGYSGNGETCTLDIFRDCNEIRDAGNTQDGVYSILPSGWYGSAFNVYCKMTIDGGAWTVFQRRSSGSTSFYRNWASYKNGFGDIQGEFWLGNDKLYYLTQQGTYELRVDFSTSSNTPKYAKYSSFRIDNESTKYRVTSISGYSGNGYDGMGDIGNRKFSTHDQDNDGVSSDCAEGHRGGWWYWSHYYCSNSYRYTWRDGSRNRVCAYSNPNGDFNGGDGKNIYWINYHDHYKCYNPAFYSRIKYMEMKIRRTL